MSLDERVSTDYEHGTENSPTERSKREICMTPEEEADETILQLDIADQSDPELREMVDYVKKLADSDRGRGVVKATDDEDVIEYYWTPQQGSSNGDTADVPLQSWESGSNIAAIRGPRNKSNSIAYDSAKYGRRQSLAETIIIPKTVKESYDADSLVSLQKEAEEYKHIWGIDVADVQPLTEIRTKHVSSRRHSVAFESPRYSRMGRRRTSLAETMIIPKSVQTGYDFATFVQMEQEGEEYNRLWGLNAEETLDKEEENDTVAPLPSPSLARKIHQIAESSLPPVSEEEVNDISAAKPPSRLKLRRSSAQIHEAEAPLKRRSKSRSISMGILSRRQLFSNRRPSFADLTIIPRTISHELDEATMALLDNEAMAYKLAFPDIEIPASLEDDEIESNDVVNTIISEKNRSQSPVTSHPSTPHKVDYNEWYHKFGDQTTSHIETTFSDEDEEVSNVLQSSESPDAKTHIFYSFPQRTTPTPLEFPQAQPQCVPSRPTTPADYAEYMHKFPEQLSPDINPDGHKSPATLETYLKEMESPGFKSPTPGTTKPIAPPATLEVYLERMRSQSPSPMSKP